MFPRRVAWLARPPGVGREQEVLLAAAVSAGLTDTIAAQLHGAVAVAQDVHPVPALYDEMFFFKGYLITYVVGQHN